MNTPKELEKVKELTKSKKAKIASSAVALTTSASLLLGGLFTSPADLMQDTKDINVPPPVVEIYAPDPGDDGGGGGDDDGSYTDEDKKRGGIRDSIRNRILRMPAAVRACIGVPLWALGWLLITGLSALWGTVLSPIFSSILGWALTAGLILLVACVAIKCAHPDVPFKKIAKKVFSKKPILITVLSVAALAALDNILPGVWLGYEKCRDTIMFLASSAVLGVVGGPLVAGTSE